MIYDSHPGRAIVETADKEHASLVVMGTRGLGKLRRTILGSVSSYVLHHAHCPVVICPTSVQKTGKSESTEGTTSNG